MFCSAVVLCLTTYTCVFWCILMPFNILHLVYATTQYMGGGTVSTQLYPIYSTHIDIMELAIIYIMLMIIVSLYVQYISKYIETVMWCRYWILMYIWTTKWVIIKSKGIHKQQYN